MFLNFYFVLFFKAFIILDFLGLIYEISGTGKFPNKSIEFWSQFL